MRAQSQFEGKEGLTSLRQRQTVFASGDCVFNYRRTLAPELIDSRAGVPLATETGEDAIGFDEDRLWEAHPRRFEVVADASAGDQHGKHSSRDFSNTVTHHLSKVVRLMRPHSQAFWRFAADRWYQSFTSLRFGPG